MSDKYIRLKDGSDYLNTNIAGIDASNIIADFTNSTGTYTATQDCFIVNLTDSITYAAINGVRVVRKENTNSGCWTSGEMFVLKKGQVFTFGTDYSNRYIRVFGLKF